MAGKNDEVRPADAVVAPATASKRPLPPGLAKAVAARKAGIPNSGGKKAGSHNKQTLALHEVIRNALDKAGGEKYLVRLAYKNPALFVGLLEKLLPMQLGGANGGPVVFERVTRVIVDPRNANEPQVIDHAPQQGTVSRTLRIVGQASSERPSDSDPTGVPAAPRTGTV